MGLRFGTKKGAWTGQAMPSAHGTGANGYQSIINNNIQGLSINYSNQIIQNVDTIPIHSFMVNKAFMKSNENLNEDSSSSNLNSHRRCKS